MADRYEAAEFADDPLARAARALRYMEKMAVYASCGELGRSTLLRLQVGSATVLGYGLPDLVLRRDSDGVWFVHDEGLGDRHADRHAPKVIATEDGVIATPAGSQTRAERQAEAKRRYKEKRRAELAEKERARRARDRGDG